MNGAGNDFIVIDNRFYNFSGEELSDIARRLCPRRFGVGADGILAFMRPDDADHDYRMLYYNADGSRGTMCGNGARCLARFARDAGMMRSELQFESDAGVYRAVVEGAENERVKLFVPPPRDFKKDLILNSALPTGLHDAAYIWPGVEHVVLFVDDVSAVPVGEWGPPIRHDAELQPAGANVNFVEVESASGPASIIARTYEKGVEAETRACGTGALASALVGYLTGRLRSTTIDVQMPGGLLRVGFTAKNGEISDLSLEGPVESVFRGTVYI